MKRRKVFIGISSAAMAAYGFFKFGSLQMSDNFLNDREKLMPVVFLGHGSPMNAITENFYTLAFQKLGETLPKPKAILMISAHWMTKGSWLTHMSQPKTIHDFYGFPKELFEVQYPAPGDPKLAERLQSMVKEPSLGMDDSQWGLDHGTWSVLKHIYPKNDVPVVQLSLDMTQSPEYHFQLGQKLRELRSQGVLIMGSGNIVHNLRKIKWEDNAAPSDWALEYDGWVKEKAKARDFKSLVSSAIATEAGRLSIPSWDHYFPLLYVLGASTPKDNLHFDIEGIQNGSISMRSLRFG